MVKYNKVNVKLSDSQLNKLDTAAKNQTGETLNNELLLTAIQKTRLRNAFENNISTDIKLSRT